MTSIYTRRIYATKIYATRIYATRIYRIRFFATRIYTTRIYTTRIYTTRFKRTDLCGQLPFSLWSTIFWFPSLRCMWLEFTQREWRQPDFRDQYATRIYRTRIYSTRIYMTRSYVTEFTRREFSGWKFTWPDLCDQIYLDEWVFCSDLLFSGVHHSDVYRHQSCISCVQTWKLFNYKIWLPKLGIFGFIEITVF